MKEDVGAIVHAVVDFVDAARLWGLASGLSNNKTCGKAVRRAIRAELKVRDLTGSVDILLPLLKHEDPAVRFCAAIPLLCDHRSEAVHALRHLDRTARLDLSFHAGASLQMIGEPNTGSRFEIPDTTHEPIPTNAERYAMLKVHLRELDKPS